MTQNILPSTLLLKHTCSKPFLYIVGLRNFCSHALVLYSAGIFLTRNKSLKSLKYRKSFLMYRKEVNFGGDKNPYSLIQFMSTIKDSESKEKITRVRCTLDATCRRLTVGVFQYENEMLTEDF